ncbi:MAG: hypothetical protein M3N34_07590 [Pseudomonadota bacterium]|nr:hypothetical protein [Pseudomonadota bacterium]
METKTPTASGRGMETLAGNIHALSSRHSHAGQAPFTDPRTAALVLLTGNYRLSRRAGQFLGQIAVDLSPMSEAQTNWLAKLLDRAGLPPLAMEGAI